MVMIETEQLSKKYESTYAVKNLSIQISKGEIYGFIGLNGAGKTTTMKMLLGMIEPTKGCCYINGQKVSVRNPSVWKDVGYMIESSSVYPELTVKENLQVFSKLRFIQNHDAIDEVMKKLNLTKYAHMKAQNLSRGNLARLGIAKAILHHPKALILDEPMNGLDPEGIIDTRKLLQKLAKENQVTVFISSHQLSELAKIATTIGIIHKGQLIQEIGVNELHKTFEECLVIDTKNNSYAFNQLSEANYKVQLNQEGMIEILDAHAIKNPDHISQFLVNAGIPPTKLIVKEEDLEAYFMKMIARKEG